MALSKERIAELYGNRRVKGLYEERLTFLMTESDEPGIDPAEEWPMDFAVVKTTTNPDGTTTQERVSKSASTLYQGFNNAAKKLGITDQLDVIQRDGSVFILVKSRVSEMFEDDEDTDTTDGESDEEEIPVTTMNGDGTNAE